MATDKHRMCWSNLPLLVNSVHLWSFAAYMTNRQMHLRRSRLCALRHMSYFLEHRIELILQTHICTLMKSVEPQDPNKETLHMFLRRTTVRSLSFGAPEGGCFHHRVVFKNVILLFFHCVCGLCGSSKQTEFQRDLFQSFISWFSWFPWLSLFQVWKMNHPFPKQPPSSTPDLADPSCENSALPQVNLEAIWTVASRFLCGTNSASNDKTRQLRWLQCSCAIVQGPLWGEQGDEKPPFLTLFGLQFWGQPKVA